MHTVPTPIRWLLYVVAFVAAMRLLDALTVAAVAWPFVTGLALGLVAGAVRLHPALLARLRRAEQRVCELEAETRRLAAERQQYCRIVDRYIGGEGAAE